MKAKEFNKLLKAINLEHNFNKIYVEYYPLIVRYTNYLYRGRKIGKDVAQEIFTYFLTHENLPYVNHPTAWIKTLCKNIGSKHINTDVQLDESIIATTVNEQVPLKEIIEILPSDEKEIIELKYIHGFTLKEIAEIKKRSYTAVLKHHYRILKKLEKFLSKKSLN
ncbi:MAG: sigma-70 family RNA polymerase sigma factor [Clostridiales bacterium]|nr:sigma-70 family RNA polymerase sigma factor [Clostridiales bacterium]